MCTSVFLNSLDGHFGRNLDVVKSYGEEIVITTRNYPLDFRKEGSNGQHLAMLGIGKVVDGKVLYFDAVNEAGLAMAGLSFDGFAVYHKEDEKRSNVASFELINWVLGKCKTVLEAKKLLENTTVIDLDFDKNNKATPLHWMIADKESSLVVESCKSGLSIYDNKVGVLTNSPEFDAMMYIYDCYEGIPGDYTSLSRFVKAAKIRKNIKISDKEWENVSSFYHILGALMMQRGSVIVDGDMEETLYSSCYNLSKGILYYRVYTDINVRRVSLLGVDLNGSELIRNKL